MGCRMIKAVVSEKLVSLHDEHDNAVGNIEIREEANHDITLKIEIFEERNLNIHIR